jgi:hypothetical protein
MTVLTSAFSQKRTSPNDQLPKFGQFLVKTLGQRPGKWRISADYRRAVMPLHFLPFFKKKRYKPKGFKPVSSPDHISNPSANLPQPLGAGPRG